jgi:hypothetical protein
MMTIVNLHQRETRRSVPGPDTSSEHKKFTFRPRLYTSPPQRARCAAHQADLHKVLRAALEYEAQVGILVELGNHVMRLRAGRLAAQPAQAAKRRRGRSPPLLLLLLLLLHAGRGPIH